MSILFLPRDHYQCCATVRGSANNLVSLGVDKKELFSFNKMKIFGIDYAPLLIPLERRRQTFAVFFWIGSFFFMGPIVFLTLLYMFFFTRLYFIPLLYLAWYIADKDTPECGGRRYRFLENILISV